MGSDTESEYEPYDHRDVKKPLNLIQAINHILSAIFGRGLMALPFAIQKGGLATSFIMISLFWIFYPYCINNLVKIKYKIAKAHKKPYLSYPTALYLTFMEGPKCLQYVARCSRKSLRVLIMSYHLISCMAYVSYVCFVIAKATGWEEDDDVIGIYKLLLIIPLAALTTCIESLHALTFISLTANISTIICTIIVFVILFKDGFDKFSAENVIWFGTVKDTMNLMALSMFSLEPLGIYIAVEENMKKPALFHGIKGALSLANIFPATLFITIGILGSFRFKDVTISKEFPKDKLELSFLIIYAIAIVFTYPLYYYVGIDILWKIMSRDANEEAVVWAKPLCRMTVNILVVLFGLAVPFLEIIVNISYSFMTPLLCLMLPALMQLIITYGEKKGEINLKAFKEIVIVLAGFAAFIVKFSVTIIIYCCT